MKTRLITLLSVLTLLAVSCDDSERDSAWDDPKYVHIVAPMEAAVADGSARRLAFQTGQQIKVWEQDGNSVNLSANSDSTFISYEWIPKAVPTYAAFPADEETVCTADGVFTLAVDTVQKVLTPEILENIVAVGKVTGLQRTSYKAQPMRNVTGYLALRLGYPLVTSIKVESVAGEAMAGDITVDYGRLAAGEKDFYEVIDPAAGTSVTLVPSVADTTLSLGTYYLALLPGTYSGGFRVTVEYQSGTPMEMTCFSEGVTVERAGLSYFGDGYADDDLPDDVRIDLNFAESWPFKEEYVSAESQSAASFAGDTYTFEYRYQHEGVERTRSFPFFVKGNKEAYTYEGKAFNPGAKHARITLPSVPGRYVKAVRYETADGRTSPKGFQLNGMDWQPFAICQQKASKGFPATLSFPTEDGTATGLEASYYMYLSDAPASVSNISVLYSKELPESYDPYPFGDELRGEDFPRNMTLVLDFKRGWPFNEDCVPAESQTDEGEMYTYTYQNGTTSADLKFFINRCTRSKEVKNYAYSEDDKALCFNSDDPNSMAMITLPVIPDRYVKEIRAVHCNTKSPYPRFNLTWNFKDNTTAGRMKPDEETVFTLPYKNGTTTISSELNQSYSLRTRDPGMKISEVTIVYSAVKPQ